VWFVSQPAMTVSPAKLTEPIEMPFVAGQRNHVLDGGVQITDYGTRRDNSEGEKGPAQDMPRDA